MKACFRNLAFLGICITTTGIAMDISQSFGFLIIGGIFMFLGSKYGWKD